MGLCKLKDVKGLGFPKLGGDAGHCMLRFVQRPLFLATPRWLV